VEALLHDDGVLVAPTAAIISTFIAVLIAQFYKDHFIAKVILVVTAGILSAAAIGATFYSQHQIVAERIAEQQRKKEIREQLGNFISDGLALMENCGDNTKPPPWSGGDAWMSRLIPFLDRKMNPSYVIRLRDPAGVPVDSACRNADAEHNRFYHLIYSANFHLEKFSEELGGP
jgi:hypothetical protein